MINNSMRNKLYINMHALFVYVIIIYFSIILCINTGVNVYIYVYLWRLHILSNAIIVILIDYIVMLPYLSYIFNLNHILVLVVLYK